MPRSFSRHRACLWKEDSGGKIRFLDPVYPGWTIRSPGVMRTVSMNTQSGLSPQPSLKIVEPRRHKGHKGRDTMKRRANFCPAGSTPGKKAFTPVGVGPIPEGSAVLGTPTDRKPLEKHKMSAMPEKGNLQRQGNESGLQQSSLLDWPVSSTRLPQQKKCIDLQKHAEGSVCAFSPLKAGSRCGPGKAF